MFKYLKKLVKNDCNSNNFNGAIIDENSSIIVNGKRYTGKTINISNGKVIIDGNDVDDTEEPIVNIIIYANSASKIEQVTSTAGEIIIHGNASNIDTTSGDITINGNVEGNISTVSGDIRADVIEGNISTISGDIIEK